MSLGERLLALRKKEGLSQECVAKALNVSHQTISKWETGKMTPDSFHTQSLCQFYNVSYDYLFSMQQLPKTIINRDNFTEGTDWTKAWSKEYPILASYQKIFRMDHYASKISKLYEEFIEEFDFNTIDAFLILKDLLYQHYLAVKKDDQIKTT